MTPHVGELIRTLAALRHDVTEADVAHDRAGHARLLAETARATVLLKGSVTVIASPGGGVLELPSATQWLATAGSGDVLAGLAGALLASGVPAADSGALAAWLHASAALTASGGGPILALDIADHIPRTIADLLSPS
jgi:NAD(P)H-hydrate repair Nnr-like enzyme with NAD(P)H-hydrate dehydratase domain